MFLPYFYYPLACVMLFYQEGSLYDFLKDRATRLLWEYFDSAKNKNKHQLVDEVKNWTGPDFDLNKMTFEQCMRKFRPASDEIAHMGKAVTDLLESRATSQPWQGLMERLTAVHSTSPGRSNYSPENIPCETGPSSEATGRDT